MKPSKATLLVARWEFLRYLKLKQQIIGMVITFVMGLATMGVARLADGGEPERARVAVIGSDILPFDAPPDAAFGLERHEASSEGGLRGGVVAQELDGLLIIRSADQLELIVTRRSDWIPELHAAVTAARQHTAMAKLGLQPQALADVLRPPSLDVTVQRKGGGTESKANVFVLFIVLGVMMMSIFMGMSYIFASITGEKQIRVTEQIISAVPAQSWIDGKILGLIGVSLVTVANTAIAVGALLLVVRTALPSVNLRFDAGAPLTVAVVVLFGILGLFFWFAFLGAVAAMIDDPYDSSRGSLLMVPIGATTLAFLIVKNPDGGFARVLSLIPATSPSAMPARMLISHVPGWEFALSLVLLVAGVLFLRTAAGRIFRLGMLMYGKEPTWSEVRRWALAPSPETVIPRVERAS